MRRFFSKSFAAVTALGLLSTAACAAGAIEGGGKQPINVEAIAMFGLFVLFTLGITKWAAARNKSAADFYTAGGGITGFQNGLALAGDYMSAASFLGISGLGLPSGFDGLHLLGGAGWIWLADHFSSSSKSARATSANTPFADVVSFTPAATCPCAPCLA